MRLIGAERTDFTYAPRARRNKGTRPHRKIDNRSPRLQLIRGRLRNLVGNGEWSVIRVNQAVEVLVQALA
jgi:hypothetical protein